MAKKPPKKKPAPNPPPETTTLTKMRASGWTRSMVDRILGEPDLYKTNPRYKSAAPMRLYFVDRVVMAEDTAEFTTRAEQAKRRSETTTATAKRKADELILEAEQTAIRVTKPSNPVGKAIASYNDYATGMSSERGDYDFTPASRASNKAFLDRITVNYLRHECTTYDNKITELAGRIGVNEAVWIIRKRVFDTIAKTYPEYADECDRQYKEKRQLQQEADDYFKSQETSP